VERSQNGEVDEKYIRYISLKRAIDDKLEEERKAGLHPQMIKLNDKRETY